MKKLKFNKRDYLLFLACGGLCVAAMYYDNEIRAENPVDFPHPLSIDEIAKYSNNDSRAVIIYPIFTQYAYQPHGFYDYYGGKCDISCITVKIDPSNVNASYTSGVSSFKTLRELNYSYITDIDVNNNPSILKNYDKIILLHNEYMTRIEFNAIMNHTNVVYMFPNSAYAMISYNQSTTTMKLLYGHGFDGDDDDIQYHNTNVTNGFGFVTTSKHEYDLACHPYHWIQMPNGMQLSCFPEFLVLEDRPLLETIKDYPEIVPPLMVESNVVNASNLPNCNQYGYCPNSMPNPK